MITHSIHNAEPKAVLPLRRSTHARTVQCCSCRSAVSDTGRRPQRVICAERQTPCISNKSRYLPGDATLPLKRLNSLPISSRVIAFVRFILRIKRCTSLMYLLPQIFQGRCISTIVRFKWWMLVRGIRILDVEKKTVECLMFIALLRLALLVRLL